MPHSWTVSTPQAWPFSPPCRLQGCGGPRQPSQVGPRPLLSSPPSCKVPPFEASPGFLIPRHPGQTFVTFSLIL